MIQSKHRMMAIRSKETSRARKVSRCRHELKQGCILAVNTSSRGKARAFLYTRHVGSAAIYSQPSLTKTIEARKKHLKRRHVHSGLKTHIGTEHCSK